MNILIVPNFWYHFGFDRTPGGIEKVVIAQYDELKEQGHNVFMLVTSDFLNSREDKNIIKLPMVSSEFVKMNDVTKKRVIQKFDEDCDRVLSSVIKDNRIELILSHCTKPKHFNRLLNFNIPVCHMFHGLPYAFDYRSMKEIIDVGRNRDVEFLFVSNYQQQEFFSRFGNQYKNRVLNPFISKLLPKNHDSRNGRYCIVLRVQKSYKTNMILKHLSKLDVNIDLYGSLNPSDKEYIEEFYQILENSNGKIYYKGLVENHVLTNDLLPEYEGCFTISANDAFGLFALECTLSGVPIIAVGSIVGYDEYASVFRVKRLTDLKKIDIQHEVELLRDSIENYQANCSYARFKNSMIELLQEKENEKCS